MGRKSNKGKEKKLKRKEENAKLAQSYAKVEAANKIENPMESLAAFKQYERNGLNLTIDCERVSNIDPSLIDWAFQLTKTNMETLYEQSEWGWKDKEKKDEMTEEKARYLIVKDQDGKPVGFVHFQFDIECEEEVLYCYEIQLESQYRNKGLGKFLMQILELIANKTEMMKVMLTAFKHNHDGYDFFTKTMKFEVDLISPEASLYEESYTYVILSKLTRAGKRAAALAEAAEHTLEHNGRCMSSNCGHAC
ncbi:hypothetical protein SNE40_008904 [Patella caerulea]|uniref:N-alpha-acetyltransferase 40 n=1 Tax=Patella caerulea TaxID=87958 RepID=A0AAN8PRA5_PATCE